MIPGEDIGQLRGPLPCFETGIILVLDETVIRRPSLEQPGEPSLSSVGRLAVVASSELRRSGLAPGDGRGGQSARKSPTKHFSPRERRSTREKPIGAFDSPVISHLSNET